MTGPATLPACRLYETERLRRTLEEHGAAYISGALDPGLCAHARTAIDALAPVHWDEVHHDPRGLSGGRYLDRYLCVFNRSPYWLGFLDRPGVIELAESVLGRDCHVIGQTAWRSHPGFRGEPLHVDYLPPGFCGHPAPVATTVPAFILTVHYYLCDTGPTLAPTLVVPGSHRAGRAPLPGEQEWRGVQPQPVLAAAGDALVFRSDVWHAGSDNTTADGVRYLLQVHYGRREMAQHFSPYLEWRFDPAVLAAATRRQRRLLGDHEPGAYD